MIVLQEQGAGLPVLFTWDTCTENTSIWDMWPNSSSVQNMHRHWAPFIPIVVNVNQDQQL